MRLHRERREAKIQGLDGTWDAGLITAIVNDTLKAIRDSGCRV